MKTVSLAFRNLSRQKKRTFMLAGAIAFGFFIVTLIDGVVAGGMRNFEEQFAFLFGGNVIIERENHTSENSTKEPIVSTGPEDAERILTSIKASGIPYQYANRRTITSGTIIFEGRKSMSNIFGCDFGEEIFLKDKIQLVEGSWENAERRDAIIMSESTMKNMKIEIGDTILFSLNTYSGQANFGEFYVAAKSKDISLIGSIACYAHIDYVNELTELPQDDFNCISVMLNNLEQQEMAATLIENQIRQWNPQTASRLQGVAESPNNPSSSIYKQINDSDWNGTCFAVTSMYDQAPFLKQIVAYTQWISFGILVVLFLVVMIGIANTYRMVLYERIREIGTMRAVGMCRRDSGRVFAWEAVLLSLFGAAVGFVLAIIAMKILGIFTITDEVFQFFLKNNHITFILTPVSVLLKVAIVVLLTLVAVSGSVKKASRMNPAEALRTVK